MTDQAQKVLFTISIPQPVTAEEVDNVLVAAFEGGINYWCDKARPKDNNFKGAELASGVVSRGGTVLLYYNDGTDCVTAILDLLAVRRGIPLLLAKAGMTWREWYENHDAGAADCFVQYAVFGELVYG